MTALPSAIFVRMYDGSRLGMPVPRTLAEASISSQMVWAKWKCFSEAMYTSKDAVLSMVAVSFEFRVLSFR